MHILPPTTIIQSRQKDCMYIHRRQSCAGALPLATDIILYAIYVMVGIGTSIQFPKVIRGKDFFGSVTTDHVFHAVNTFPES